jgi:hypothetical protein
MDSFHAYENIVETRHFSQAQTSPLFRRCMSENPYGAGTIIAAEDR